MSSNASAVPYMAFGSGQAQTAVRQSINDSDYTITAKDAIVSLTAITASRTLTLPSVSSVPRGWQITIKDESGSCSSSLTITLIGTIDGTSNFTLNSAYAKITLYNNGTGWSRIG